MGTDANATIETLMTRLATLENELRTRPKEDPEAGKKLVGQFAHALLTNAVPTLKSMGATPDMIEAIRAQLLVDKLGPNASVQMQMIAGSGAQTIAMQTLQEQVATLSRLVADQNAAKEVESKHSKFKAVVDTAKDKYANLAKALEVDEAGVIAALKTHGGSVEDFAAAEEAKWAKYGLASKTAASTPSAETGDNNGQSTKTTPAPTPGNLNTIVQPGSNPAPETPAPVGWNEDINKKLIAEIVAKTASKVKSI